MNNEKLLKIAKKLIERSQAGEIGWSETADANTYSAAFPEYSVTIAHYRAPNDFLGIYAFSVYNEKGTEIESVRGDNIVKFTDQGIDETSAQQLAPLYEVARRQALKSDEILDDLLTRLSSDSLPA